MQTKQLKAALIAPSANSLSVSPPAQLGCLASVFKAKGRSVSICDFSLATASLEKGLPQISESQPSFIGISSKTVEFDNPCSLEGLCSLHTVSCIFSAIRQIKMDDEKSAPWFLHEAMNFSWPFADNQAAPNKIYFKACAELSFPWRYK